MKRLSTPIQTMGKFGGDKHPANRIAGCMAGDARGPAGVGGRITPAPSAGIGTAKQMLQGSAEGAPQHCGDEEIDEIEKQTDH